MGFGEAVSAVFKKYATFTGRASRSEYWWWTLFVLIASIVLTIIDTAVLGAEEYGILSTIFGLAILVPAIAVTVRRLHDTDRSGWWIFLGLIPIIGTLVLLFWYVSRGREGDNRFGPDPLGANVGEVFS